MQTASISLAKGIADILDDDIDGFSSGILSVTEVGFFLIVVGLLLIVFARVDLAIYRRMSPVNRMIWRRRLGLRAWR